MDFLLMFFVFWVFFVLGAIVLILSLSPSGKKEPQKPITGTNFIPSQMFMSNDGLCGLAVNDQKLRLCLLKNPEIPPQLLPISGLVGSFLVKNGEILGERLRTGPNALITFQTVMHSNVKRLISSWQTTASPHDNQRIDLIVLTHDESDPLHVVNFLDMETKEGGILYEKALSTATHWHAMLNELILHADQQARLQAEPDQEETESPLVSVADELEKLGDLVEKKLMTPQEFTIHKEKLLAAKI
jgi:hypothetical protein